VCKNVNNNVLLYNSNFIRLKFIHYNIEYPYKGEYMKILDLLSKVAILIILVLLGVGVYRLTTIDKKGSSFYEYKNTKINLKQVRRITPRVDYIITYKEDNNINIFRTYSTSLNDKEIHSIEKFLHLAQKSEFYNVEVIAYMMFDKEKIELYHSHRYLKYAKEYSVNDELLGKLSADGLDEYQYKSLEQLKDKVYDDANKFFDDVISYARLKRSPWSKKNIPQLGLGANGNKFMSKLSKDAKENELHEEDIQNIVKNLHTSYEHYLGLQ